MQTEYKLRWADKARSCNQPLSCKSQASGLTLEKDSAAQLRVQALYYGLLLPPAKLPVYFKQLFPMQNFLFVLLTIMSLQSCGQGLGSVEADKLKDWRIDEYTIVYSRKLGPAGPHYYQYDVYKADKYLSYAAYITDDDSCNLLFKERNDYYIRFNLCNRTKTILSSDKTKLDFADIDSVTIRPYDSIKVEGRHSYTAPFFDTIITKNFDSTITKRLAKDEIKTFCKRWNKAKVNGYERLGKSYDYLVTVYAKTGIRRFRTLNFFITENGLWSYETKEDNFYDNLWLDEK